MSTHVARGFWIVLATLALSVCAAVAAPVKLEAQLIWGTNEPQPHDSKIKPVEDSLSKKLKESPFKWQNYYEVSRKQISVALNESKKESMSKQCELTVKNLGNDKIEVQLFGKSKLVEKRTQPLPKGKLLLIGGNAENTTSWFVVLRQAD
jgi:hypothetical protein